LVDADPQGSLTISMGWQQPDELPTTLSTLMAKAMNDQSIQPGEGVLHHAEGVDLIPANIELAGMEVSLVNCMNREKMLKQVLEGAKRDYDFILLDCTPSLGMLTVNALAAADTTLIPVQAQYLSAKGLEQLLQTVQKVRWQINPKLKIEGILLTMTDSRTNYGQQIDNLIRGAYGSKMVDEKKIAFNPAVELSYLDESQQRDFLEAMNDTQNAPSLSQAQRLKKLAQEGHFSYDVAFAVMGEEKKDELDKVVIKNDTLRKYFPRSYTPKQMEDTIIKLLEQWQRKQQRQNER